MTMLVAVYVLAFRVIFRAVVLIHLLKAVYDAQFHCAAYVVFAYAVRVVTLEKPTAQLAIRALPPARGRLISHAFELQKVASHPLFHWICEPNSH